MDVNHKTKYAALSKANIFLTSIKKSRSPLRRYYRIGTSEAKPRGPKPKISKTLLIAINLHTSMMQVSGNAYIFTSDRSEERRVASDLSLVNMVSHIHK